MSVLFALQFKPSLCHTPFCCVFSDSAHLPSIFLGPRPRILVTPPPQFKLRPLLGLFAPVRTGIFFVASCGVFRHSCYSPSGFFWDHSLGVRVLGIPRRGTCCTTTYPPLPHPSYLCLATPAFRHTGVSPLLLFAYGFFFLFAKFTLTCTLCSRPSYVEHI